LKIGISIKLDVTKIQKDRLFKGEKGTYLDLQTFIELDEQDQYGNNGFIAQSQTKDERQSGASKPPILGNCKVFWKGESNQQRQQGYDNGMAQAQQAAAPSQQGTTPSSFDDDIPFAPYMAGTVA